MISKKVSNKINLIIKFLNTDYVDFSALKSINDLLNLPIESLKNLTKSDVALIKNLFKVEKVGEFGVLNQEDPFEELKKENSIKIDQILQADPYIEEKVKSAITISLIVRRFKYESVDSEKKESKIIVVGLNNAGKTAILTKFGEN